MPPNSADKRPRGKRGRYMVHISCHLDVYKRSILVILRIISSMTGGAIRPICVSGRLCAAWAACGNFLGSVQHKIELRAIFRHVIF